MRAQASGEPSQSVGETVWGAVMLGRGASVHSWCVGHVKELGLCPESPGKPLRVEGPVTKWGLACYREQGWWAGAAVQLLP